MAISIWEWNCRRQRRVHRRIGERVQIINFSFINEKATLVLLRLTPSIPPPVFHTWLAIVQSFVPTFVQRMPVLPLVGVDDSPRYVSIIFDSITILQGRRLVPSRPWCSLLIRMEMIILSCRTDKVINMTFFRRGQGGATLLWKEKGGATIPGVVWHT